MNNYVYIIAGLPEISLSEDNTNLVYEKIRSYIYPQLSKEDQEMVHLLEEGFDENCLTSSFYERAMSVKNKFIREYYKFDLHFRNKKVDYLARRLKKDATQYKIAILDEEFEEDKSIQTILGNEDFVIREVLIDQLKWEKATELTKMEYFSLNVILSFLVKANIVQRWSGMDKKSGEKQFKKLIDEVRGTFRGIENNKK